MKYFNDNKIKIPVVIISFLLLGAFMVMGTTITATNSAFTGNVTITQFLGIGTTTPSQALQVIGNGNITGNLTVSQILNVSTLINTPAITVTSNNGLVLKANEAAVNHQNGSGTIRWLAGIRQDITGNQNDYVLYSYSGNVLITGTGTGNLGVGELVPGSKLSVSGGATIGSGYDTLASPTNGLLVQGNLGLGTSVATNILELNGTSGLTINQTVPVNGITQYCFNEASGITWCMGIRGTQNYLVFATGSGMASNEKVVFDDSGDVGINTVSPNAKLDVNGTVRGNYTSLDGTAGFTGTCTLLSMTNFTVKNGIITGCS